MKLMNWLNSARARGAAVATLIVAAACSVAPAALAAQGTGTIRGTITAADTRAPINAARIAIAQPERVALANQRGSYVLRDVPAGSYELVVTAIGYAPARVTVTVSAGRTSNADVAMDVGPLLLSSLVVSATRTPIHANRLTSTVNVLTPQEIATSPARQSQDLLREMPGVELPRTSSLVGGSAQIVSIRGVDEGRTNVLFDGIPVTDAWGEWVDWGRVPKDMLDHVEVVEGGTSTLYGNGAIGGVISFFSRPVSPGSFTMTVDGGSRDARHIYLGGGIPLTSTLSASINGDYTDGGGYTLLDPAKRGTIDTESQVIQRNAYARLNYAPSSNLSAFVTGHLFSDNRETGTAFSRTSRDQKNVDIGLNYGQVMNGMFTLRGWYGHQDEDQRAAGVRSNSSSCAVPSTAARQCEDSSAIISIPSNDRGASLQWSRGGLFGLQSLSIGGDYRHMDGTFDEDDYSTSCPGTNCGNYIRTVSSGGDQDLSGAFIQAIANPVTPLIVELGARVDYWSNTNGHSNDNLDGPTTYEDRSKTAFSPRLGARYALLPNLSVHAAAYKAFRAPNLAELYRKQINATASQITLPNPDLKPESGKGIEGGFDYQPVHWIQLKSTWYVADYKDFNVPTTIDPGPPAIRQRRNVNKSRSKGGEAYLALRPIEPLIVSASVNYDDARVVSDDSVRNGQHINRVPSPKQTIKATYSTRMIGSLSAMWRHEGQTTTLQGLPLKPFTVIDANVQREIVPGATAFFSVENITDEDYEVNVSGTGAAALYSFGMPRTLRFGLTLTR
jgi:outer membrane receptor protein involved in Fe transport